MSALPPPAIVEKDRRIVADGKIRHLAVTKIQQFNPQEDGCPMRWWFRDVQGRKEEKRSWHETGDGADQQITHYLATSQDVLGSVARAGKDFLPTPGRDLLLQWGLNDQPRPYDPVEKRFRSYYPPEESKVFAAGIPLIGFVDIVNGREEYLVPIDEYGEHVELRREPGVVEVLDVKTTKSFRYTKKHLELAVNTQMVGYGELVAAIVPEATHVRLSHVAHLTEGSPRAIKRSTLMSVSECRARWRGVVEPIAEQMKVVAATQRAEDVPGNLSACESFGGCPHKPYCHHYKSQNSLKRIKMGLLKNRTTPAPNGAPPAVAANGTANGTTPWIPPAPPPQAFQPPPPPAQAAPPPPPAPIAPVQGRGWVQAKDAIQGQKYILPPTNVMALYLVATGGQQSFLPCSGNGQPLAGGAPILFAYDAQVFELAPEPPPAPAVPPPPPVTQVVRDVAAPPPPPPLQAPATSVAPPAFVPPPPPQGQAQPEAPKRGRRTKAEMEAATAAEAQAAGAAQSTGFTLFVNAIPNTSFTDLSAYIADVTGDMEQQFGVPDVRAVMDDKSPIAFGRWKGVLAGLVKQSPPPPGAYAAFTKGNELTEVVVEALSSLCAPGALVRGV